MSLVWKVIHRNKLHCVLGPWQTASAIMSVRDFIIASGPGVRTRDSSGFKIDKCCHQMHIQQVESWGRGENRGTGAMNQKYVQPFYCRWIEIKGWEIVLLLCYFVSLINTGKLRLINPASANILGSHQPCDLMKERVQNVAWEERSSEERRDSDRQGPAGPETLILFNHNPMRWGMDGKKRTVDVRGNWWDCLNNIRVSIDRKERRKIGRIVLP